MPLSDREPTILVSEFGQWMRRMLVFLLIVLLVLIGYALKRIGQLDDLVRYNSTARSRQNCALLKSSTQTPDVIVAIKETC